MKLHCNLLALMVASVFFAIHPCIPVRPFHRFSGPTLIAFQFPVERWCDLPHPIKLQLSGDDAAPPENLYGDGLRPAWCSFAAVCLAAYLIVMANGGGLSLHILFLLPLVGGFGIIAFVSAAVWVPLVLWSQNRFRFSIRGLLLLATLVAIAFALLANGS